MSVTLALSNVWCQVLIRGGGQEMVGERGKVEVCIPPLPCLSEKFPLAVFQLIFFSVIFTYVYICSVLLFLDRNIRKRHLFWYRKCIIVLQIQVCRYSLFAPGLWGVVGAAASRPSSSATPAHKESQQQEQDEPGNADHDPERRVEAAPAPDSLILPGLQWPILVNNLFLL